MALWALILALFGGQVADPTPIIVDGPTPIIVDGGRK